jgi:YcxB-like protein
MQYNFTVKYSKAILSRAHFEFWKRKHGFDAVLSVIFLMATSYLLFIMEVTVWYVVVFFTIAFIFTIAVYSLYFIWRKQAMTALNAMKTPEAQWKFTDENLCTESDAGKVELHWTAIKKIWRFKEVWLLFYANGSFSTLPIDNLDADVLLFVENRVAENGGKIS